MSIKEDYEALKKEHEKCSMTALENSSLKARVLTLEKEAGERSESLKKVTEERDRLRDKISQIQVIVQ